ncbi:hypothetical protein BKA62DRAFT_704410 [Auriculariales sp. MPI-PUGE-AT-0066]|nr:hypothetical protein BKA62DRAFT_704410 [Auriculariales sp. MPI-PUGE-AT-0066]
MSTASSFDYGMPSALTNDTLPVAFDDPTSDHGAPRSTLLVVFLTLQIAGSHVLLPFLLGTFWFTSAKRNVTLTNLFVCFTLTGVVMCILLYGNQYRPTAPDPAWCKAQAALSFAVAPMDSMAVLCVLYHVWNSLRIAHGGREFKSMFANVLAKIPAIAPYLVGLAFGTAGVGEVHRDPASAKLRQDVLFFCTLPDGPYALSTTIATAIPLVVSLYFIASITITLVKRTRTRDRSSTATLVNMDVAFISRIVLYGAYVVLGVVLTALSAFFSTPAPDIFSATIPVFLAVLFGSQKDVLQAWRRIVFRTGPTDEKDAWTLV